MDPKRRTKLLSKVKNKLLKNMYGPAMMSKHSLLPLSRESKNDDPKGQF